MHYGCSILAVVYVLDNVHVKNYFTFFERINFDVIYMAVGSIK